MAQTDGRDRQTDGRRDRRTQRKCIAPPSPSGKTRTKYNNILINVPWPVHQTGLCILINDKVLYSFDVLKKIFNYLIIVLLLRNTLKKKTSTKMFSCTIQQRRKKKDVPI